MKKKTTIVERLRAGWASKHPIFRFMLVFAVVVGLYYGLAVTPFFDEHVLNPHFRFNARVSSGILRLLGQDSTAAGVAVFSSDFSLSIARGCDAIGPSVLFIAGVLAFPAPFSRKAVGILTGTLLLMATNFIRIVSLFLIGIYHPRAFELMHFDVWQVFFIVLVIALWYFWLGWVRRGRMPQRNVSGKAA